MRRADLDILPEPFVMCLGNLFTAFQKHLERPAALMYWRALHDVPVPLLEAAVGIAVRERTWLPKPAEVRKDAEACRKEIRARFPWKSCGECSDQGWTETEIEGVKRMVKCDCVAKHHRILVELGAQGPALLNEAKTPETEPLDVRLLAAGE